MITWYANIFNYSYFQLPQLKRMNTSLGNIDNVRQKVFGNTRLKLSLLPVVFWTLYSEDKLDETYVNLKRTLNSYFNLKSMFDAKLIIFFSKQNTENCCVLVSQNHLYVISFIQIKIQIQITAALLFINSSPQSINDSPTINRYPVKFVNLESLCKHTHIHA